MCISHVLHAVCGYSCCTLITMYMYMQMSADSRALDVETLRRMHENVKRTYGPVAHSANHGVGGVSGYGTSQTVYEAPPTGRSYTQPPPSSKYNYPSSTSYSDNWPYSSETQQLARHNSDDMPTTQSDSAYYHTPSTYEDYPYASSAADVVTSKNAVTLAEERSGSRHSYVTGTDYSEELTSQMNQLNVSGGGHVTYQTSTDTPSTIGQSSTSSAFSAASIAMVPSVEEPPTLPQTSSRYEGTSSSWYDSASSSRYDVTSGSLYEVTAGGGHHSGYGSISSTPSSSGMTVTSGSGYPVVPTACSNTEQQLRERVRQLEQMVKQKDVTIEEQRSQLKYSGPQKVYQDAAMISPGPATLYSSGSLSSPHHSGLLQHAYGTPPSISPQATMQHVGYYPHAGAPTAGTAYYTAQPAGYSSQRWSGPLSAPLTGNQYPSPPGSLPAQQTITPPGTHLVGVLHHSGPILMPATATPTPPPQRQVQVRVCTFVFL